VCPESGPIAVIRGGPRRNDPGGELSTDPLAIYLNDHVAASVGALQLIETLAEHAAGSPLEAKLRALRTEIENDQGTLRQILARVDPDEHRLKQAASWIAEKVSRGRLALASHTHPALALLEGLETLGLGIQGKLGLWNVLAEVALRNARLAGFDYEALQSRANIQHALVEGERVAAARVAFAGSAPADTGAGGR
jgi:hypothetical protein